MTDTLHAIDPSFARLIDREEQHEARVQRVALASWAIFATSLVLSVVAFLLIRNGAEAWVELVRGLSLVVVTTGLVSLLAASAASLRWLVRPRTASLRAIETRLAALERLLASGGAGGK